jgi:beta-galactosidase
MQRNTVLAAALIAAVGTAICLAETYSPEPSDRVDSNMGVTPWKFIKGDPTGATAVVCNEGGWKTVGVPHTVNDDDTYINNISGDGATYGGMMCYRKHFTLPASYSDRKVFIEFGGANVGAAVYINGTFIKGNSTLNPQATYAYGFEPFIVDATPYVHFDGTDNVLAVRVSNGGGIYGDPGFGGEPRFGQHDGGLFRPVWMRITNKVYVPANIYSVVSNWGTCVGTVSASDASATVRMMTNVMNESGATQSVTVTTKVVDDQNTVVLTKESVQSVDNGTSVVFDQSGDIASPKLWYPANSPWGKPNMHKVYHIVKVGGKTVDVFTSPLGIRKITWDTDYPYINGHKQYMWGMAGRYNYPALGSAVPDELLWKDAKLVADCGGTSWRPGHSACAHEFVEACDAFGVMIDQPSGDGEGAFQANNLRTTTIAFKTMLHRDMIVHDRNNPSILMWEVTNAGIIDSLARSLKALALQWDPIDKRAQSDRSYGDGCKAGISDVIECSSSGCEAGQKNGGVGTCGKFPAYGAEAWDAGPARVARFAYDHELEFAGAYMQNWKASWKANAFGLAHWYLAEPPGEVGQFLGDARTARSFGSSAMDANRIPKLLYNIYRVAWIPFSVKPGVAIAHHWNRSGNVRVNVFSNCPKVRLSLNGNTISEKVPNPAEGLSGDWRSQTTTGISYQCYWDVTWAAGTLLAEGLDSSGKTVCSDQKVTAGDPDHIKLTVDPNLQKPDGTTFQITANGTDVATILATVVDKNNNWCPTANSTITFAVSGPCEYRGSTDAFVTPGQAKGTGYHAPLDPELNAEGGMTRIAVRSKFEVGTVGITATSPGLGQGTASYTIEKVGTVSTIFRPGSAGGRSGSALRNLEIRGKVVRYYLETPSVVGFEMLDAGGRVIGRIAGARQSEGYHSVPLLNGSISGKESGNGVYFIRGAVDGKYMNVKRMIVLK